MYTIDFKNPVHVHFIGIGGISMSGLAEILLDEGFRVSGSDNKKSPLTDGLEAKGCKVFYSQRAENITGSEDVVVYTAAIRKDNPELACVLEKNIPVLTRAELLGQLMKNYKIPVAISGTHGKTTTTSMLSEICLKADANPTISVGGILPSIGGNIKIGGDNIFITEACEYTDSFLSFFPKISVILNVEADHLDYFKDLSHIRRSFNTFANLLPSDGLLVINHDIENFGEIAEGLTCPVVTFGQDKDCSYWYDGLSFDKLAHPTFNVHTPAKDTLKLSLSVPGLHNVYNCMAAFACADALGIDTDIIIDALSAFKGTNRRFEYKGSIGGITILDDYAHHPTEIAATLKACSECEKKELWCVFQPHTYTRTKAFFDDFANALKEADHVVLADIYAARETDTLGISSEQLKDAINNLGGDAYYFRSFDEIENFLLEKCNKDDMLITMGAGDIVKVGEHLLGQ